MKNPFILGGIAIVVLAGGYMLLTGNTQNDAAMMQKDESISSDAMMKDDAAMGDEAMMKDEGTMMEKDSMMQKGSYEAYAASKLAAADHGDVVLFFRASWCPTCKALDASIRAGASTIPKGLTILDVDYDNSAELKKKYGVTYQHTLVQVDSKGNLIKKWSGSPTLAALVVEVQ